MRILAPFDQTHASQATIPLLCRLARMSRAETEITLVSVWYAPIGIAPQQSVRDGVNVTLRSQDLPVPLPDLEFRDHGLKGPGVERVLAQLHGYLANIAARLPTGIRVNAEAHISDRPTSAITDCASYRGVDLIVMATRSRPRASSLLFGSTTEAVVDSGVAPTLVVHPQELPFSDQTNMELRLTRRARSVQMRAWLN